jgi:hypothetical protein
MKRLRILSMLTIVASLASTTSAQVTWELTNFYKEGGSCKTFCNSNGSTCSEDHWPASESEFRAIPGVVDMCGYIMEGMGWGPYIETYDDDWNYEVFGLSYDNDYQDSGDTLCSWGSNGIFDVFNLNAKCDFVAMWSEVNDEGITQNTKKWCPCLHVVRILLIENNNRPPHPPPPPPKNLKKKTPGSSPRSLPAAVSRRRRRRCRPGSIFRPLPRRQFPPWLPRG